LAFRKPYRRGYPVALLVGVNEETASIWKIFSNVVKPEKTVHADGSRNNPKALYNFHEAIVNALRPTIKEGVKSIVLASPLRTNYASEFLNHVRDHHAWLVQGATKAVFAEITGAAASVHDVTVLTRGPDFRRIIGETTLEETENLLDLLEKRLNAVGSEQLVLYSLEEIESAIYSSWVAGKPKPEYIALTDTYNQTSRQKHRLQRLQQIATNKGVKIRIVSSKSAAGKRISQLGGVICILQP
jgi:stalled ribosome rescue protein Dom34